MGYLGNTHARGKGKSQKWANLILAKTPEELGEECILWPFNITTNGYGRLSLEGVTHTHHRAMWILKHGAIPEGMVVRHRCRNKACANTNHHELGTHKQNIHDKKRDGTQTRGSDIHCSKLTESQVREIHRKVAEGENQKLLMAQFGISSFAINQIIKGRTWQHLELPYIQGTYFATGESACSKLKERDVREIHKRYTEGETKRALAEAFKITAGNVGHIVKGRAWKHLNLGVVVR